MFGLLGVLVLLSPGKPKRFLDEAGRPLPRSISEKVRLNIGGVEQGMFIRAKTQPTPSCYTSTAVCRIIS
jgi:hypothetical protein